MFSMEKNIAALPVTINWLVTASELKQVQFLSSEKEQTGRMSC